MLQPLVVNINAQRNCTDGSCLSVPAYDSFNDICNNAVSQVGAWVPQYDEAYAQVQYLITYNGTRVAGVTISLATTNLATASAKSSVYEMHQTK